MTYLNIMRSFLDLVGAKCNASFFFFKGWWTSRFCGSACQYLLFFTARVPVTILHGHLDDETPHHDSTDANVHGRTKFATSRRE